MSEDRDNRITVGILIAKKEYHFSTTEEKPRDADRSRGNGR